ncbi:unnamed protein product, partial [Ectocarpus sp. 13 AM-2016]
NDSLAGAAFFTISGSRPETAGRWSLVPGQGHEKTYHHRRQERQLNRFLSAAEHSKIYHGPPEAARRKRR